MKDVEKKTFWLLVALVVVLGAAVVAEGVAMTKLHTKVDALSNGERTVSATDQHASVLPPQNSAATDPMLLLASDWDPFKEMYSMQERIDQMFGDAFNRFGQSDDFKGLLDDYAFSPDIDIEEKADNYLVTVNVPGFESSKVNVKADGQVLTISGEVNAETKKDEQGKVLVQERRSGKFLRTVTLPSPVEADKMTTKQEKGVLHITLPKLK